MAFQFTFKNFLVVTCIIMHYRLALASASHEEIFRKLDLEKMSLLAPPLVFRDDLGKSHSLAELKANPAIVHFWALWCEPCKKELPQLEKLAEKAKTLNIQFLPLAVTDEKEKTKVGIFLKEASPSLKVLIVEAEEKNKPYLAWGIPVTYFVNSSGQVVARARGSRSWNAVTEEDLKKIFSK